MEVAARLGQSLSVLRRSVLSLTDHSTILSFHQRDVQLASGDSVATGSYATKDDRQEARQILLIGQNKIIGFNIWWISFTFYSAIRLLGAF